MKNEVEIRKDAVMRIAEEMLMAARTAPKARGNDRLFLGVFSDDENKKLSQKMTEIAQSGGPAFFERDAKNILQADVVIVLGTKIEPQGLSLCGFCGFENCDKKENNVPCAFNTGDLGIAIGSAVSIAMDKRVDNRIMFSAGYTAIKLGLTPPDIKIAYAIPLSVSGKNPFFDRK